MILTKNRGSELKKIINPIRNAPQHTTTECIKLHGGFIEWAYQRIEVNLKRMFNRFDEYIVSSNKNYEIFNPKKSNLQFEDSQKPKETNEDCISIFRTEDFVNNCEGELKEFMLRFVKTQTFVNYKEERLTEYDNKINSK